MDVKASVETIFKIIDDDINYHIWNIVVKEVSKLNDGEFAFKTTVGDVTSKRVETVKNKKLFSKQTGSPITGLGYSLNPKGDVVEVIEPDAFYYCTATGLLAVSRPQVIRGTRLVPPVWFKKKTEQKPVKKEVAKKVKKDNADS